MTKKYGVIGDPIAHSLSPLIHNGWLQDLGIDATYEAVHVPAGTFESAFRSLKDSGFLGLNITLPHKIEALTRATDASEAALVIGAANTLSSLGDDHWRADNTDAPGFLEALGQVDPASDHVLLLGAGGSAKAIAYALSVHGIRTVILNRTMARAEALANMIDRETSVYGSLKDLADHIDSATIVINTTSLGHAGEIFQLPAGDDRLFFDISYGKIADPQLQHAAAQGWRTKDGLTMLVAQAAFSFEIWFGAFPNLEAALGRCRAALETGS